MRLRFWYHLPDLRVLSVTDYGDCLERDINPNITLRCNRDPDNLVSARGATGSATGWGDCWARPSSSGGWRPATTSSRRRTSACPIWSSVSYACEGGPTQHAHDPARVAVMPMNYEEAKRQLVLHAGAIDEAQKAM